MNLKAKSHPVALEYLIAFAIGQLEESKAAAVAAHLSKCEDCAKAVALFSVMGDALHPCETYSPPPAALARAKALFVDRRIQKEEPFLQRLRGSLQLDLALTRAGVLAQTLAACVLLLSLGILIRYARTTPTLESLYTSGPIARQVEPAALGDDQSDAQEQLAIVETRVLEVEQSVSRGEYDRVPDLTTDLESRVRALGPAIVIMLQRDPAKIEFARDVERVLFLCQQSLVTLQVEGPPGLHQGFQQALSVTDEVQADIREQMAGTRSISSSSEATRQTDSGPADSLSHSGTSTTVSSARAGAPLLSTPEATFLTIPVSITGSAAPTDERVIATSTREYATSRPEATSSAAPPTSTRAAETAATPAPATDTPAPLATAAPATETPAPVPAPPPATETPAPLATTAPVTETPALVSTLPSATESPTSSDSTMSKEERRPDEERDEGETLTSAPPENPTRHPQQKQSSGADPKTAK